MRVLGLPLDAWFLLVVAIGLGLSLELAFMRARRREGATRLPESRPPEHGP